MQKMISIPTFNAARVYSTSSIYRNGRREEIDGTLTLVAMSSSVSWKMVRRSEWPRMTQGRLRSFNWWSEISPV